VTNPHNFNRKIRFESFLFLILVFIPAILFSQTDNSTHVSLSLYERETTLSADSLKLNYPLSDSLLIPEMELVRTDTTLLVRGTDYSMDYLEGVLILKYPLPTGTPIKIQYQKFPFALKRKYFKRIPILTKEYEENNSNNTGVKKPTPKPQSPRNLHT